jgi:inorganic pyrophosphatase/exopolyphosphatase
VYQIRWHKVAYQQHINLLASKQFKAKSQELAGLSAAQLVTGDQKSFSFKTDVYSGVIGFAVIETTDDDVIMQRKSELLMALKADKASKNLDGLFLAVVNIVKLKSQLLVCGDLEKELAIAAFKEEGYVHPTDADPAVLDMGGLVSRKKDYIPPLTKAIKLGFSYK